MGRFGQRLRAAREEKGLTVRELGRQARVRYSTISEVENGHRRRIHTDEARRLARVLGVGVDYLIGTFEEDEDRRAAVLVHT